MGVERELIEFLNSFSENSISEKELCNHVNRLLKSIWRHGLSEENIAKCLKTLFANQKISKNTQKTLMQCLVPKRKLSKRTVNLILQWFFSNVRSPYEASMILHWLYVMVSNNMIDAQPVENVFNQLLMCLFIEELAGKTCDVLKNVVKPGLVTPKSVFIIQHYCNLDIKLKDKGKVLYLQRLFYDCAPSLFVKPPAKALSYVLPKDKFFDSVSQFAFQNKFLKALPAHLMPNTKKDPKYKKTAMNQMSFNPFAEIDGMKELGLLIRSKEISLLDINSALGSKEGIIYLCWNQAMGCGFPENAYSSLEVLDRLLNICQRIRNGLNFVPAMMPGFLLSWDGEENHEVIYELISWMHFDSFKDLYKDVLYYIVNLYITGTVIDKTRILYSLTKLIANKVTSASRETTVLLISLVGNLIKIGLCGTALQSSMLLMASVRFYKYLSLIEERYMLGTWTVAPPFVVFGAVFTDCFVLISEICSLVVRYNTVMLSKLTSLGYIDKFEEEEEIVKTYLKDIYLFLWEGQASKTELIASEVNESIIGPLASGFDSIFTVRNHSGIKTLVTFLATQLKRDPKTLTNEDIMKVLTSYCEGLVQLNRAFSSTQEDVEMDEDL